jgi:hypothetical protein
LTWEDAGKLLMFPRRKVASERCVEKASARAVLNISVPELQKTTIWSEAEVTWRIE